MTAYLIANVDVHDPAAYEDYRSRTGAIVERHGGEFIVRGGKVHMLEGEPWAHRLVIIQFADLAAAQGFYHSPEYQEIIPLRTLVSDGALLIVEGAD
jgi:uncharacterized protein (DUF1330 family)